MCSYKFLRGCLVAISFLNLVFFFLLTLTVIIIASVDDFSGSVMLNAPYIAFGILVLVPYLIGMVSGFCGAIKEDKYCMITNTVLITIATFFLMILLISSAAIVGTVEDQLQKHCENKATSIDFDFLDVYDQNIINMGNENHFCEPDCACRLPTTPIFTHEY